MMHSLMNGILVCVLGALVIGQPDLEGVMVHTVNELPAEKKCFEEVRAKAREGFARARVLCDVRNTFASECRRRGVEPMSTPGFAEWDREVTDYAAFELVVQQNLRLFDAEGNAFNSVVWSLDPGSLNGSMAHVCMEDGQFDQLSAAEAKARLVRCVALSEVRYEALVGRTASLLVLSLNERSD